MTRLLKVLLSIFALQLLAISITFAGNFDTDDLKIKDLKKQGIDVTAPQRFQFLLSFKTKEQAAGACKDAEKLGFKKLKIYEHNKNSMMLWVSKSIVPELENIKAIHKQLMPVAKRHAGTYEDVEWEVVPN